MLKRGRPFKLEMPISIPPWTGSERRLPPGVTFSQIGPEEQLYCCCGMVGGEGGVCGGGVIVFCVTMWPLFNLSPSGGGLPVGTGLGRRQPPRGAAGRGQQRCPVLVLLRHADVQGGPRAGENQRRAGSRQVTAPQMPPCPSQGHGRRGAEGTPLDCCCPGGGAAGNRGPRPCGARAKLPSRLRAALRGALCRSQPAAFVAPGEPAAERCCLPHRIPPCLPRTAPAAPRAGSQQGGSPRLLPSLPPLSDVIPPFGLVPSSCSHFPALLPPCQPRFPCSADISWWFCCFAGRVGGRRTPQTFLGKQARDEGDPQSGKNYWRKIC